MPTLFPYAPVTLTETIRSYTDVRKTAEGEFRDSLAEPTYILGMEITALHAEAARLEGLYRSDPIADWYVPLWQDASFYETAISISQTVFAVDTNADYRVGGLVMIRQNDQLHEVLTVLTAIAGTLTTTTGAVNAYPGTIWDPTIIAPVVTGVAPGSLTRQDKEVITGFSIVFECPDALDIAATTYPVHRTYDVVADETIVMGRLAGAVMQKLHQVRNGFGHIDLIEDEEYQRASWTMSMFDTTQAARWTRRKWLHRARGRDMPFWVPTWKNDLPLDAAVASAAVTAVVQRVSPVVADYIGRSIQFLLADGTAIYSEITGAIVNGGDTNLVDLTIAAPGTDIPATSIVSWMHLCRFDTDQIKIKHKQGAFETHSSLSAPVIEVAA